MRSDTVLVVDDEPAILDAYTHYLDPPQAPTVFRSSRSGGRSLETRLQTRYRLLRAASGEEAIQLVRREVEAGRAIAAGFFDIKMPGGLDGLETIRAVREIDPNILCAVVTAYNDRSIDDIAGYFPAQRQDEWDYLSKPFTEGEIQQKARNLTSSWQRRRREETQRHDLEQLLRHLSELKGLGFPDLLRCLDYVLGRVVAFTGAAGGFLATVDEGGPRFQVGNGCLADEAAARAALDALRTAGTLDDLLLDPSVRVRTDLYVVPILCVRAEQVVVFLRAPELLDDRRDLVRIFAENAAAAVDNHHLYDELQRTNASLEGRISERTSELQGMLEQLKQTQQQLVHSEKLAVLGQTAATVAHEINNPASFLQVNLEELGRAAELTLELCRRIDAGEEAASIRAWRSAQGFDSAVAEAGELVTECQEGLDRILTIVRDLRSFARSSEAEDAVRVAQMVDGALRIMGNDIRHRARVRVVRRDEVTVRANEGRLLQVVINLLANALYAFGDRPAEANLLDLEVRREGSEACISVRDNGCGIPEELRERIFEPFFTTKPIGDGTGLGLGICRSIVEQHGGTIAVESTAGRGSEFVVRLPAADARG